MRSVPQTYLDALRGSHGMDVRVRVCTPGQTGTSPTGTELNVIGGSVTLDATADVRGICSLVVDGTGLWPTALNLLLAPYGNEIYIERSVEFGDGGRQWVGLGYFRLDTASQETAPDGPIEISGSDRMQGLIDARLDQPRQFLAGTSFGTVMSTLVTDVYPAAVIDWDSGSGTLLTRPLVCDSDRWQFLNDLISALGKIWYWDYRGRLQIKDPPSATATVWDVNAGPDGVLVSLRRSITRIGAYNAVVASGEAADTSIPITATARDDDSRSPTRWGGPFGKVPEFFTSPAIATLAQAQAAATTRLRKQVGLPYEIDLSVIPNPALEPWDPVRVLPSTGDGYTIHVLTSVVIPLTAAETMTCTSREQTTLRIGVY